MTTLQQIFEDLSHGEFSQVQLGGFNPDEFVSEPDPRQYAQIASFINSALRDLYSKFWLATDEVVLNLVENIEIYTLHSRYAISNTASTEPVKYIQDSAENPFQDNVLKIEEVFDESGNTVCLNDEHADYSYFTPRWNRLQVPWPNNELSVAVMYRATHERIVFEPGMDPNEVYIDLPPQLHDALLFYVASRFHGGTNLDEGGRESTFFQKYQTACAEVQQAGLFIQPVQRDLNFERNGWI